MQDLLFVVVSVAAFGVLVALVSGLEKLRKGVSDE